MAFTTTQNYGYDGLNRLTTAQEGANWKQTFDHDQWGNRWIDPANTNGVAIPTGTPIHGGMYDAKNRLTGMPHDPAGNGSPITGRTYQYDVENRLVAVNGGTPALNESFAYDGEGRRVKRTVNGVTTTYVYDAFGQLAQEYGGTAGSPGRSYLFADHLGSTRMVTSGDGTVRGWWDYLPYGEEIAGDRGNRAAVAGFAYGGEEPSMMFTGQVRDRLTDGAASGLDYFGARYFSGAQGRFTSPDIVNVTNARLASPTNTLNKYTYGANNPLKFIDPDGKDIVVFYSRGGPAGHLMMAAHNPETNDFAFRSFGPTDHSAGTMSKQALGFDVPGTEVYELPKNADDLRQRFSSMTIQTTPEQAQAAIDSIRESGGSVYTLYKYNCTTACQVALREAGIQVNALTPKLAWEFLYVDYSGAALARKNSRSYQAWRARLLPSLVPRLSIAPDRPGVDYGNPPHGFDSFGFVMKMLQATQRGCVTVQGARGPETSCEP